MDILGLQRPGWNPTTYLGHRFPDRPMQRQLLAYDSVKRADYNYRAEWLDTRSTESFVPRANKFQVSQRDFLSDNHRSHPNLIRPPYQRQGEEYVHPRLGAKTPWHSSTEALTQKEREQLTQLEVERARRRVRTAELSQGRETLVEREARHIEEQRAQKRANAELRAKGITPPADAPPSFYHITHEDYAEMAMQVPTRKMTTWSLASI